MGEALALAKRAVEFKPISSYWGTFAYTLYKKWAYKEADEAIKKHLNCNRINRTICHTNKLLNRALSISRGRAPLRRNARNITILNPLIGRPRKDKKMDKTNMKQELDTDTIPVMPQDPFLSWEALDSALSQLLSQPSDELAQATRPGFIHNSYSPVLWSDDD